MLTDTPTITLAPLVAVTRRADDVLIRIAGEVDLAAHDDLAEAARYVHAVQPVDVTADLSGVGFFSCTGVNFLVKLHNDCASAGRNLQVAKPPPSVLRVLTVTGVLELLHITYVHG